MVERRVCTFCGDEIEPGTGRMYIKKDGVIYNFCTSKCFKNLVILGRVPRRTTWTQYYAREKQVRMKGAPTPEEKAPKARKVKKSEAEAAEKTPAKAAEKEAEQPKPEEKAEAPKEEKPKAGEKKPQAKAPVKRTVKKSEGAKKEPSKAEPKAKPEEADKE